MKVSIRFSEEEAIALEVFAKKENISISQYVKNKALNSSDTAPKCETQDHSATQSQYVNWPELAKIILDGYIHIKALGTKSLAEEDEKLIEKTYHETIKRFLPNFINKLD